MPIPFPDFDMRLSPMGPTFEGANEGDTFLWNSTTRKWNIGPPGGAGVIGSRADLIRVTGAPVAGVFTWPAGTYVYQVLGHVALNADESIVIPAGANVTLFGRGPALDALTGNNTIAPLVDLEAGGELKLQDVGISQAGAGQPALRSAAALSLVAASLFTDAGGAIALLQTAGTVQSSRTLMQSVAAICWAAQGGTIQAESTTVVAGAIGLDLTGDTVADLVQCNITRASLAGSLASRLTMVACTLLANPVALVVSSGTARCTACIFAGSTSDTVSVSGTGVARLAQCRVIHGDTATTVAVRLGGTADLEMVDCDVDTQVAGGFAVELNGGVALRLIGGRYSGESVADTVVNVNGNIASILLTGVRGRAFSGALLNRAAGTVQTARIMGCQALGFGAGISWAAADMPTDGMLIVGNAFDGVPFNLFTAGDVNAKANSANGALLAETPIVP